MADQQQEQQFDALSSGIEEALVYDMAAESQARALDMRLASVERMPAGYLARQRASGQIRNPWMPGPFFNISAQEAIRTSYDPEVQKLAVYLAKQAGQPLPAPNYDAIAKAEQNAKWEKEMADWVVQTRANRERVMAEHNARLQAGGLKTPAHIRYVGPGGGGI